MEKEYADLAKRLHKILNPYAGSDLTTTQQLEIEVLTLHLCIAYHDGLRDGLATARKILEEA
jgi:hypothetical protein